MKEKTFHHLIKWVSTFLFFSILMTSESLYAQHLHNETCGTITTKKHFDYVLSKKEAFEKFKKKQSKQIMKTNHDVIHLQIHILRKSDGTEGLTQAELNTAISDLNTIYQNEITNMEFVICNEINYIDDSELYAQGINFNLPDPIEHNEDEYIPYMADNMINIFYSPLVEVNDSIVNGYAHPPTNIFSGTSGPLASISNFIAVRNGTSTNGSTLPHEIGHYFGLFHTHLNNGYDSEYGIPHELVTRGSGANCEIAGDLLCDTEADPNLSGLMGPNCTYIGTGTDAQGASYTPMTDNIMSYSVTSCRTSFTTEQLQRIRFFFVTDRNYLITGACDVACDNIESSFTLSNNTIQIGEIINITNTSIEDNPAENNYSWTLNGNEFSTNFDPNNDITSINSSGNYSICLDIVYPSDLSCMDTYCETITVLGPEVCGDNLDNDGDLLVDCIDPECYDSLTCNVFPCSTSSVFYQIIEGDSLFEYDPASQNFNLLGTTPNNPINAIGYNIQDGFIYGIVQGTTQLMQISLNPQNTTPIFTNLGDIPLLPAAGNNGIYYIGDFDLNGNLYVSAGDSMIHQINIATQTWIQTYNLANNGSTYTNLDIADFSFLPSTGNFYSIDNLTGNLIIFNPTTGIATDQGALSPPIQACVFPDGIVSGFGATYADNQGNIYAFCNGDGILYRIDPINQTSTQLQDTNYSLRFNDGASCPLSNGLVIPTQNTCTEILSEAITCNADETVTITIELQYNNPDQDADNISITDLQGNPLASVGGFILTTGDTYTLSFTVDDIPGEFCFRIRFFGESLCCHREYCVEIPICDPCDYISTSAEPLDGEEETCCFTVDLTNDFSDSYFTHISTNIITPGVSFSSPVSATGWTVAGSDKELTWTPSGNIPLGTNTDAIQFCLENILYQDQIPQEVVFNWHSLSETGDDVIICSDTLMFNCDQCLYLSDDELLCNDDGTYTYNFTVWNNTDPAHDATHIRLVPLDPTDICLNGLSGPLSMPLPNAPLASGGSSVLSVNISDCVNGALLAGDEIQFRLILIDEGFDLDWCCHADVLSLSIPDCGNISGDCTDCNDLTSDNPNIGFTISSTPEKNCQKQLSGFGLSSCDDIRWTINGQTAIDANPWTRPTDFNFINGITYNVCMEVVRTLEDGTICSQTYCQDYTATCVGGPILFPPGQLNIIISPNPVKGSLRVNWADIKTNINTIEIYNINGIKVLTKIVDENLQGRSFEEIDISHLNNGAFFIKVISNENVITTKRFIKTN